MEREEYNKELKKLINTYNNIWNTYYNEFSKVFKLREEQEELSKKQKEYDKYLEKAEIVETDELKNAKAKKENIIEKLKTIENKLNDPNIPNQEKEMYTEEKEDLEYALDDILFEIDSMEMDSFSENAPDNKQEELDEVNIDIEQEEYNNKSIGSTEKDYDERLKNALNEINEFVSKNNFSPTLTEEEKNEIIQEKAGKINEEMFDYDNKIQAFQATINDRNYSYKENNFRKTISTLAIYERNRVNVLEGKELLKFESDNNKQKEAENIEEEKRLVFEWYENGKKFRYTERTEVDVENAKKAQEELEKQEAQKAKEETRKEQESYRVKYDKNYNEIKEIEENLERYDKEKEEHIINVDKALKTNEILEKILELKSTLCNAETRHIIRNMHNDLGNQLEQETDETNKRLIEKKRESIENTGLDLTDRKIPVEKIDENIMSKVKLGIEEIVEIEAELELQREQMFEKVKQQENVQEEVEENTIDQKEQKELEEQESKDQQENTIDQMDKKIQSLENVDFLEKEIEYAEETNNERNEGNEIHDREEDDLER